MVNKAIEVNFYFDYNRIYFGKNQLVKIRLRTVLNGINFEIQNRLKTYLATLSSSTEILNFA